MFPPTWKTPPWRNIDVNMVTQGDGRPGSASAQSPASRQGMRPNSVVSARGVDAQGELVEENEHIERDEADGDEGCGATDNVVLEGEHGRGSAGFRSASGREAGGSRTRGRPDRLAPRAVD